MEVNETERQTCVGNVCRCPEGTVGRPLAAVLMNYSGLSKVDYFLQTMRSRSSASSPGHFNDFNSED